MIGGYTMTVYDNLKDYFILNKMNVISQGIKDFVEKNHLGTDYIIDEISLLTLERINLLLDDVMTICLGVSSTSSDKGRDSHEVYYYNVIMTGNISKGFSELHILDVGKASSESLWTETTTSLFGLPDISYDRLEEEAEKIHSDFCRGIPRDKKHKYWFPVIDIKEKYKRIVNMHMWPADLGENIMGEIRFEESFATIYDVDYPFKPYANYHIPANTILLNVKYYRNESKTYDDVITATHELIHWELHQEYFKIRQLLDGRIIPMQCSEDPVKFDENMSDKDKALWYAEWQANELAIRVAIPRHFVKEAISEYESENKIHHDGLYYANMIYKLAFDFNVPPEVMKLRFRQLGYDFADGVFFNPIDDIIFPPFTFAKGSLNENETFVINRENYERLLSDNKDFAELINSKSYIYTGYVVCRLDTKYIKIVPYKNGVDYCLSDYARENADICCLKFSLNKTIYSNKYMTYVSEYLCRETFSETSEYYFSKKDKGLSSLIKGKIEEKKEGVLTNNKDIALINEMIANGVETFSEALKYIMDKANKPRLTKDNIAEVLGCDGKTVQNYRNGKTPDTIEKVMLICLACKTGPEVSKFLIKKSVGGIPDVGMKKTAYNFLLEYTNTSLEYWNKILDEFGVEHIERFGAEDK